MTKHKLTKKELMCSVMSQAVNDWLFKHHDKPADNWPNRMDMLADLSLDYLRPAYDKTMALCEEHNIQESYPDEDKVEGQT